MAGAPTLKKHRSAEFSFQQSDELGKLWKTGELTDFSIESSDGHVFRCHRVILASCSALLKRMMLTHMAEASAQAADLGYIPADVMKMLLHYMYTGEVEVASELLLPTVQACHYLELLELKAWCVQQVVLKPDNVILWCKLATLLEIEPLKSKCWEMLLSSLADVSQCSEFLGLNFAEVTSYITDLQELHPNPDELLNATLSWISHKPSERCHHMHDMIDKVPLCDCSLEALEKENEAHGAMLASCPAVGAKLTRAAIAVAKQHSTLKRMLVLGGQQFNVANKVCWELHSSSGTFAELCEMDECAVGCAVCSVPGGFVLTGGKGSTRCMRFTLATRSWKPLAALLFARYAHGSIFVNGWILLLGGNRAEPITNPAAWLSRVTGKTSESIVTSASVHSLKSGEWTAERDLPFPVNYPEVSIIGSCIFVLDSSSNRLVQLHVGMEAENWIPSATLPAPLCFGARMLSVGDSLVVAGGNSSICAQYKPATDTWTTGVGPAIKHNFGALVSCRRKLYLVGGAGENRVEEYDMNADSWTLCNFTFPHQLGHLHGVLLNE